MLQTGRCNLVLLQPDNAHLLLAYRQRNLAHLSPWESALQGQGLMYEVAQVGITYMFDTQGLHRIMANHMPANVRSEQLLRRLGFAREGYARAYLKIAGQWQDHVLNALVNTKD